MLYSYGRDSSGSLLLSNNDTFVETTEANQCESFHSLRVQTCVFHVLALHGTIVLYIQKPLNLDDRFIKKNRIVRCARILLVCYKTKFAESNKFTLRLMCMSVHVKRYGKPPIVVLKKYRSQLEKIHIDYPTHRRILREGSYLGLQTAFERL